MDIYRLAKSPRFKKYVIRLGIVLAAATGFKLNQSAWKEKLQIQQKEFAAKEWAYREKIKKLEAAANPFRFYEYDSSGVKIADLRKIDNEKFVNSRVFAHKFKTPPALTPKLLAVSEEVQKTMRRRPSLEADDSLLVLIDRQKKEMSKNLADGDYEAFLKNGDIFLRHGRQALTELNAGRHRRFEHYLEKSDQELEKELSVLPQVMATKAKSGVYGNRFQLRRDIGRIQFIELTLGYRYVSGHIKKVQGMMREDYRLAVEEDSLLFEDDKLRRKDSLIKAAAKPAVPLWLNQGKSQR